MANITTKLNCPKPYSNFTYIRGVGPTTSGTVSLILQFYNKINGNIFINEVVNDTVLFSLNEYYLNSNISVLTLKRSGLLPADTINIELKENNVVKFNASVTLSALPGGVFLYEFNPNTNVSVKIT
jgi:hypothetical protein